MAIFTVDELNERVEAHVNELHGYAKDAFQRSWEHIRLTMEPHVEPVPCSDFYVDENGNEVQDYEDVLVEGYGYTNDEDVAYFLWSCGCSLWTTQDYYDGSPSFTVKLPETEEEYKNNKKEYYEWYADYYE